MRAAPSGGVYAAPVSAARISAKIHGLPSAARPTITPAQPLWRRRRSASVPDATSPLPTTGTRTCAATAAKNEQAKNEYDIAQLENELRNAKVIDEALIDTSIVGVGAVVKLKNLESGMEFSFQIVGSAETDPAQGKISNESPVGRSLLGHSVGESVDVATPGGVMHLTIQSIGR